MKRSPWVPLDAGFQHDDDIIDLSAEAELVFVRSLAHCKAHGTGGAVRRGHLPWLAAKCSAPPEQLAAELVSVGLWQPVPSGGWDVPSYESWNGDADAEREAKRSGARLGNHRRWGHPGPAEHCPKCNAEPKSHSDSLSDSHTDAGQVLPGQSHGVAKRVADETRRDVDEKTSSSSAVTPRDPVENLGTATMTSESCAGTRQHDLPAEAEMLVVQVADKLVELLGEIGEPAAEADVKAVRSCLAAGWATEQLVDLALDVAARRDVRRPREYLRSALRSKAGETPPVPTGRTRSDDCAARGACVLVPACFDREQADCIAAGAVP